jgi:hypothetical protein
MTARSQAERVLVRTAANSTEPTDSYVVPRSGVENAALTDHVPLGHAINRYDFCSDVHPEQCKQQVNTNPNQLYAVSPGYFSTIGQDLLELRDFNAANDGRNHMVVQPGFQTGLEGRYHDRTSGLDGVSWRMVPMMPTIRFHLSVSEASCLRPTRVRV